MLAAGLALAVTGCGSTQQNPQPEAAVVTPGTITLDPGCFVCVPGKAPGQVQDITATPESLSFICNGHAQTVEGDFTHQSVSTYALPSTGIRAALVVGGQARIWSTRGPASG